MTLIERVARRYFSSTYEDEIEDIEARKIDLILSENELREAEFSALFDEEGNRKSFEDINTVELSNFIRKSYELRKKHNVSENKANLLTLGICNQFIYGEESSEKTKLSREFRAPNLIFPFLIRNWSNYLSFIELDAARSEQFNKKEMMYLMRSCEHLNTPNIFSDVNLLANLFFWMGKKVGAKYIHRDLELNGLFAENKIIDNGSLNSLEGLLEVRKKCGELARKYIEGEFEDYNDSQFPTLTGIIELFSLSKGFSEQISSPDAKAESLSRNFYELGNILDISHSQDFILYQEKDNGAMKILRECFSIIDNDNPIPELFKKSIDALPKESSSFYLGMAHFKLSRLYENEEKIKRLENAVRSFDETIKKKTKEKEVALCARGNAKISLGDSLLRRNQKGDKENGLVQLSEAQSDLSESYLLGPQIFPLALLAELRDKWDYAVNKRYIEVIPPESEKYSWKKVVDEILSKEKLVKLEDIKRGVSFLNDKNGLMSHELIFKTGETKKIKEQFIIENFIFERLKDSLEVGPDDIPFTRPICLKNYLTKEGYKEGYIMRRIEGSSLEKKFSFFSKVYSTIEDESKRRSIRRREEQEIKTSLENLVLFQTVLHNSLIGLEENTIKEKIEEEEICCPIKPFDYLENLLERAIVGKKLPEPDISSIKEAILNGSDLPNKEKYTRLGYNENLTPFLTEYNRFYEEHLKESPLKVVLHGDFHLNNVIEGGTIIDPKSLKIGNPLLDSTHFLVNPRITKIYSIDLMDYGKSIYLNKLKETLTLDNPTIEALNEGWTPHVIYNSICLMGAMIAQKEQKAAQDYSNTAIKSMEQLGLEELKGAFSKYALPLEGRIWTSG